MFWYMYCGFKPKQTSLKNILIYTILFLYYGESLVSSNLNSNLLRFHCAHPTVRRYILFIYRVPSRSKLDQLLKMPIGTNYWYVETYRNKFENWFRLVLSAAFDMQKRFILFIYFMYILLFLQYNVHFSK